MKGLQQPTQDCLLRQLEPEAQRHYSYSPTNHQSLDAMKAVILAGGLGTRLAEETYLRPKPMVEVGGKPILWHILKPQLLGINDFIICCGYKDINQGIFCELLSTHK